MKQSPQEKELMQNLGPSKFSAQGFLGFDPRPVDEIISEDLAVFEKYQITTEALVKALKDAYQGAKDAFGAEVSVRTGITAIFHESMGRVPSPFRGDGVFEKGEAVLTDTDRNRCIIVTPLGIHLIEKYGFFQGRGSRHRIEPVVAIEMLGLRSDA